MKMNIEVNDTSMMIAIEGRLDTLTAPDLEAKLKEYKMGGTDGDRIRLQQVGVHLLCGASRVAPSPQEHEDGRRIARRQRQRYHPEGV